jgi:GTPase SAR1 family protein
MYDISDRETFTNVAFWLEETRKYASQYVNIILVGNKSDLEESREVPYQEGLNFALQNNIEFYECSSLTGQNVEDAVFRMIRLMRNTVTNPNFVSSNTRPNHLISTNSSSTKSKCF